MDPADPISRTSNTNVANSLPRGAPISASEDVLPDARRLETHDLAVGPHCPASFAVFSRRYPARAANHTPRSIQTSIATVFEQSIGSAPIAAASIPSIALSTLFTGTGVSSPLEGGGNRTYA